jgi:hypothetical protein
MWKLLGTILLLPALARAAPLPDPSALCERAVAAAEASEKLPPRLLDAIAVTESGRPDPATGHRRPWPWTINAQGEGRVFATKQDAIAAVKALQAQGIQSIDTGCLQVNLLYHPGAFATLDEAFDPVSNARYAARFLNTLYARDRDWASAVGAYHSQTPALGEAYRVLVMARWQGAAPPRAPTRAGSYGAFASPASAYAAFAPASTVYGAFAPTPAPAAPRPR